MFEYFTKTKAEEYLAKVDFIYGRTSLNSLLTNSLPQYIQSYLDNAINHDQLAVEKAELHEAIERAISLNISYIIKPKSTLIKFLFGKLETKPAEEIQHKLNYFQFYRYYIDFINEFISLNNPLRLSLQQVETLIDVINKKIYEEITDPDEKSAEKQRLNLVKLLYYFFMDYLPDNKPINKRLPKAILSAFFYDKGFIDIKKNIDGFFKDDIFIQEAIQLMTPRGSVEKPEPEINAEDDQIAEFIKKAKEYHLSSESTQKEVEQTVEQGEKIVELQDIEEVIDNKIAEPVFEPKQTEYEEERPAEHPEDNDINIMPVIPPEDKDINIMPVITPEDKAIYSSVLMEEARKTMEDENLTQDEKNKRLTDELFYHPMHRARIIKKLFGKSVSRFRETVNKILEAKDWGEATYIIDEYFELYNIDFLSADAIRFVDILQTYFQEVKTPIELKDYDEETEGTVDE